METATRANANGYDAHAEQYAASVASRVEAGLNDPLGILPRLLELLGDVSGQAVLDAGCGEGYLARILADLGAHVTAIDLSPRLIELARDRDGDRGIEYRAADLSRPQPDLAGRFDAVASYLVLNDVLDYQGLLATLSTALKPGGRVVLTLNNPYSYVVRQHAPDYFASGTALAYRGMAKQGLPVHFYQRTLEEYLDACLAAGLRLTKLADLSTIVNNAHGAPIDTLLPDGYRFPYFMLLALAKP